MVPPYLTRSTAPSRRLAWTVDRRARRGRCCRRRASTGRAASVTVETRMGTDGGAFVTVEGCRGRVEGGAERFGPLAAGEILDGAWTIRAFEVDAQRRR